VNFGVEILRIMPMSAIAANTSINVNPKGKTLFFFFRL
jgi:hypothetical protein